MEKSYKRKNYYNNAKGNKQGNWNNSRKKFTNYLTAGMTGFLCTCNFQNREKDCIRESIKVLEEYSEKSPGQCPEEQQTKPEEDVDIETQLEKEVASLQTEGSWRHADGAKNQKFTVADTGVKSTVFISAAVEDPVKLARAILDDAFATKVQKTRFLLRIIPVEVVCKANLEDIKKAAEELFKKHFFCDPTTFAVLINKRCNDKFLRDEVTHALALLVTDRNREHKANLKEPQKTILVEVIKGLCCISVLEDYKKLKHYNLAELTKQETDRSIDTPAGGDNCETNEKEEKGNDGEEDDEQDCESKDISEKVPQVDTEIKSEEPSAQTPS